MIMPTISWRLDAPPLSEREKEGVKYLFLFSDNIVCSGAWRYGRLGEPQQSIIGWRCDCCGRFGTPTAWYRIA